MVSLASKVGVLRRGMGAMSRRVIAAMGRSYFEGRKCGAAVLIFVGGKVGFRKWETLLGLEGNGMW